MLHGGMGSASLMRSSSGFDSLAKSDGFMVVYAEGTDFGDNRHAWNTGYLLRRMVGDADDFAYFDLLLDRLVAQHGADPSRIYMTGGSNGGMMTFVYAVARANHLAAIAFFAKHPNLEEFSISSQGRPNRVTDKALSAFATIPKLKRLNLNEAYLTYEGGLRNLAPLKGQLLAISFNGSLVLAAEVEKLRRYHPSLEDVTSTPTEILEAPNSRGVIK